MEDQSRRFRVRQKTVAGPPEPLNGYPIVPRLPSRFLLLPSKSDPVFFRDLPYETVGFQNSPGFVGRSQESLLDDITLATIHDFNLRKSSGKKDMSIEIETTDDENCTSQWRPLGVDASSSSDITSC